MARNKGTFKFASNFEVKTAEALDPRIIVENKEELIDKETWPYDGDTLYLYNGLVVSVSSENSLYMLIDKDKALAADYSGWIRIDATGYPITASSDATTNLTINANGSTTTIPDLYATYTDQLRTARNINLTGDVTGSVSFNGSKDVSITTTVKDDSHSHSNYVKKSGDTMTGVLRMQAGINLLEADGESTHLHGIFATNDWWDIAGYATSTDNGYLDIRTGDNGNEPIYISQIGSSGNVVHRATILDGSGNTQFPGTVTAPTFSGALSGNASTASKLATTRTITLTGDASGSASFDGSANISIPVTIADDSHTHATSASSNATTNLTITAGGTTATVADLYATYADQLRTARTISLTGDVTGSTSFNGTGNVSINATVANDSHEHSWIHASYNGSGGDVPPNYIGTQKLMCKMMSTNPESTDAGNGYCDWILMNAYTWSDVPYATAIGVKKASSASDLHAYIMSGPNSSDQATWNRKELATIDKLTWSNISGKPSSFTPSSHTHTISQISDLNASWDSLLKSDPKAYVTRWPSITEVTGKQNFVLKLNGGATEDTNIFTYNGTAAKSVNITPSSIGAAAASHSHPLSGISDLQANWDAILKAAPTAYVTRWPSISEVTGKQNLTVTLNNGTTEGVNKFTYNGTYVKTINVTPSSIRAIALRGTPFNQYNSGNYIRLCSFTTSKSLYDASISLRIDPKECQQTEMMFDLFITVRLGSPTFRYVQYGEGSNRSFWVIGDGNDFEVWMNCIKTSYDGYGFIKVMNYNSISSYNFTLACADTLPTNTYSVKATRSGYVDRAIKADQLYLSPTINGTTFNGTTNITTANWGTARNIGIVNSDGTGTAVTTSVNGSTNVNLKLPSTIKATLSGNASTASALATARTISLTGDVTGSVSFNGSANVSMTTAVADNSHNHLWANITDKPSWIGSSKPSYSWSEISGKPITFTPSSHTHGSDDVTALTGYSEGTATTTLSSSMTLNAALASLQNQIQTKAASNHTHTQYIEKDSGQYTAEWDGETDFWIGSVQDSAGLHISLSGSNANVQISGSEVLTSSNWRDYITVSSTDTKNTTGTSNSTSKLFLVGGTSQSSVGVVTYSNNLVYTQSGQLYATRMNSVNGFYETSDARLKDFKEDVKALDTVDQIPTKYFTWKDDENKESQIGTSAQEVEKLYPELVSKTEDDTLTVDYAKLSIIALAAIKELKAEIQSLKEEIKQLKSK